MEGMFSRLIRAVVRGEKDVVSRLLATHPELATAQATDGATRGHATEFFFEEIRHYLVSGDSALHMAAAAFQRPIAELLMRSGANCGVRNRRGAEPLHYAADANRWEPAAQRDTIAYLLTVGADPNALDRSGVAPLHRAVRTRASEAYAPCWPVAPMRPSRTKADRLHCISLCKTPDVVGLDRLGREASRRRSLRFFSEPALA